MVSTFWLIFHIYRNLIYVDMSSILCHFTFLFKKIEELGLFNCLTQQYIVSYCWMVGGLMPWCLWHRKPNNFLVLLMYCLSFCHYGQLCSVTRAYVTPGARRLWGRVTPGRGPLEPHLTPAKLTSLVPGGSGQSIQRVPECNICVTTGVIV